MSSGSQWFIQILQIFFQTLIVHQHKRAWELINKDHFIVISMQDKNSSSLVRIIMGTR